MRGVLFHRLPRLVGNAVRGRVVPRQLHPTVIRCFASSPPPSSLNQNSATTSFTTGNLPEQPSIDNSSIPEVIGSTSLPSTSPVNVQNASPQQPIDTTVPHVITQSPGNEGLPVSNELISTANTVENGLPGTNLGSNVTEPMTSAAAPSVGEELASNATEAVTVAAETASATSSFADTLLQPAMGLLSFVHDFSALPWWLSIVASTIIIRSAILPVTIMTMRNSAKMGALKDDIAEKRELVMEAVKTGNRPLATERQTEMQTFLREAGVAPGKILIGPLVQLPVFLSFFIGIRRVSQSNPEFTTGGAAWFTDISVMDPTYTLPVLCGITLLGMTELGGDTGQQKLTPQMRNIMRGVAVLSIPMTYWFPTAVFCYWIPNNLFSILLGAVVRTKTAKKAFGLDVHPAQIPGTRAWKEKHTKVATLGQNAGMVKPVDTAAAVASYSKSVASDNSTKNVKPVLLKVRPRKGKRIKAGTNS